MKKVLLVLVAVAFLASGASAFAGDCGCAKPAPCNTCPKPACECPAADSGFQCTANWIASWGWGCPKPACSKCGSDKAQAAPAASTK